MRKQQDVPNILDTYLFCCPTMDLNLRCLPRDGGYYNQYNIDMYYFTVIESRIINVTNRKMKQKEKANKGFN